MILWIPLFAIISAFFEPCYDNGIYFLAIYIKQIPKRSNKNGCPESLTHQRY